MHAIGFTFGGVTRSETKGEHCRIRIQLELQKPLRRCIFIVSEEGHRSWVPFKYEKLLGFCFGCRCMGHEIKECSVTPLEVKKLPEDDFPYSLAFKAEVNFLGKVSLKLGSSMNKAMSQSRYLGSAEVSKGAPMAAEYFALIRDTVVEIEKGENSSRKRVAEVELISTPSRKN